jgi:hypothetical protein
MADDGGVLFTADAADRIADVVRRIESTPKNDRQTRRRGPVFTDPAVYTARVPATTTVAAAVAATGSQVVTPASMAGIYVGAVLAVDAAGTPEPVTVTATTATTFTANFTATHTSGFTVTPSRDADGNYPAVITLLDPVAFGWQDFGTVKIRPSNGELLSNGSRYPVKPAGVNQGVPLYQVLEGPAPGVTAGLSLSHYLNPGAGGPTGVTTIQEAYGEIDAGSPPAAGTAAHTYSGYSLYLTTGDTPIPSGSGLWTAITNWPHIGAKAYGLVASDTGPAWWSPRVPNLTQTVPALFLTPPLLGLYLVGGWLHFVGGTGKTRGIGIAVGNSVSSYSIVARQLVPAPANIGGDPDSYASVLGVWDTRGLLGGAPAAGGSFFMQSYQDTGGGVPISEGSLWCLKVG